LPWKGILLERHFTLPGERTAAALDRHVISMLTSSPARLEHRNASGRFVERLYRPGTMIIMPSGPVTDLRLHTPSDFIHCALEEDFTRGVIEELDRQVVPRSAFRGGIKDKSIRRIIGMLAEELEPIAHDRRFQAAP
jgi:hypothetical protein